MDWSALFLSLKLALATLLLLLPLALALAHGLAFKRFAGRTLVEAVVLLPLVLPPTVLGLYLLMALGPKSWIGAWLEAHLGLTLSFSFSGILLASLVFNLPFMVQPIQRAFEAIAEDLREAASVSGLGGWQRFFKVELPLAWPGILSALVLTFAHTLGEFGVVLMVGGSIPGETKTLAISIYDRVQALDLAGATQMSLVLLAISGLAIMASLAAPRALAGVNRSGHSG
jgi:molybdate transport system permease protein